MLRWTARLVAGGVLFVLIFFVASTAFPPLIGPFQGYLEGWLSERLECPVRLRALSWGWSGEGLEIRATGIEVNGQLKASRVHLQLATLPLLWGELSFQNVGIDGLHLEVPHRTSQPLTRTPILELQQLIRAPMLTRLREVRIHDAGLVWVDRTRRRSRILHLTDWQLSLDRSVGGYQINSQAKWSGGKVTASGSIRGLGTSRQGDLHLQIRVVGSDPTPLILALGQRGSGWLGGLAHLRAELWGDLEGNLRAKGQGRIEGLRLGWGGSRALLGKGVAQGHFQYRKTPSYQELELSHFQLKDDPLTVAGRARLRWPKSGPTHLATQLELNKAPLAILLPSLYRIADLSRELEAWLERALLKGRIRQARLSINGPLVDIPYPQGGGELHIAAELTGLTVRYHPNWPAIHELAGHLALDRTHLVFRGEKGRILASQIERVRASIRDLGEEPIWLHLTGDVATDLADAKHFLERSPFLQGRLVKALTLAGPAALHLHLALPLGRGSSTLSPTVRGQLRLNDVAVQVRPEIPPGVHISGALEFRDAQIESVGLTGSFLGRPVTVSLSSAPSRPWEIRLAGRFPASRLSTLFAAGGLDPSLEERLRGRLGVHLRLRWGPHGLHHFRLAADLTGVAMAFPEPLFKEQGEAGSLVVKGQLEPRFKAQVRLFRPELTGHLLLDKGRDGLWIRGGSLGFGRDAPEVHTGQWILMGGITTLPVCKWKDLFSSLLEDDGQGQGIWRLSSSNLPGSRSGYQVKGNLEIDRVEWQGLGFGSAEAEFEGHLAEEGGELHGAFEGSQGSGRWGWSHAESRRDHLRLELQQLELGPIQDLLDHFEREGRSEDLQPGTSIDLTLKVPRLRLGEQLFELGYLRAQLGPKSWRLRSLLVQSKNTRLIMNGDWQRSNARTRLQIRLKTQDFGHWLHELGLYPHMMGGRGTIVGQLQWPGPPSTFSLDKLSGTLKTELREGRIEQFYFLSKALIPLNVLDWPQQVARGFKGLRTGGLLFREMGGEIRLQSGIASLHDWVLKSAPLRIRIDGGIDLADRAYDLGLYFYPLQTLDRVVAAVPVLGYLLTGEEKSLVGLRLYVVGPWSDPVVVGSNPQREKSVLEILVERIGEMHLEDLLPWR